MKKYLHSLLTSGFRNETDSELLLKIRLTNVFLGIAFVHLAFLGVYDVIKGDSSVGILALLVALVFIVAGYFLNIRKNFIITALLMTAAFTFASIPVLVTGGQSGSGHLWNLVVPIFSIVILGTRKGLIVVAVHFALAVIALSISPASIQPQFYTKGFIVRYFSVYLFLTMLSFLYETMRQRSQVRLVKAKEQMAQLQKMEAIGLLAGGVAHDFNNMLASMQGFGELIRECNKGGNAEITRYAEHIIKTAKRGSDVTGKLLAYARKGQFVINDIDIHRILDDVTNILGFTMDRRVMIKKEYLASSYNVRGDASQLQNAIMNIVINSYDAMPNGGTLSIYTADAADNKINITIKDTGSGISHDDITKIFEPFFTTKAVNKGTGLGLSSALGTIQSIGGTIDVSSEPNKGTAFKLLLPVSEAVMPVKETASERAPLSSNLKEATVLIVDDEDPVREMLIDSLELRGYKPIPASNGQEAVRLYSIHKDSIRLVLLDMLMPVMDGYDCFLKLKEIKPEVAVLICSGYSAGDKVQKMIEQGAKGFLSKPFDMEKLFLEIDRNVK
ncbi:MAG: response regulator [Fibrobacteres bacterium]|nr:response regulator [Fibrobacterota bacterium]